MKNIKVLSMTRVGIPQLLPYCLILTHPEHDGSQTIPTVISERCKVSSTISKVLGQFSFLSSNTFPGIQFFSSEK